MLQTYATSPLLPETEAVSVVLSPRQMVVLPATATVPATGLLTVTLTVLAAVAVQVPMVAVAVTE